MFRDEPIKFGTTTATSLGKLKRPDSLAKLSRMCRENADALLASLRFCAENGSGCFRVVSQILPLKTHPDCGYSMGDCPRATRSFADSRNPANTRRHTNCEPASIPINSLC